MPNDKKTGESIASAALLQLKETGKPIEDTSAFLDMFLPDEGELQLIYGRIGQGKTTLAVTQIFDDLMRGQVVYSSFPLNWDGFDQRQSLLHLFVGLVIPFYRVYKKFPKENWHYLDCYKKDIWDQLYSLNDCKIYLDDVIVKLFDSYEKTDFSKGKRQWAFETRHFNRSITLVTQRPNQVQVALRSQVNRFYKCEKVMQWPLLLFRRTEYQDMAMESVDESKPVDSVIVRGRKHILQAFNSKYLRGGAKPSQEFYVQLFKMSYFDKIKALRFVLVNLLPLKGKRVSERKRGDVEVINGIRQVSVAGGSMNSATIKNNNEGSKRVIVGGEDQEILPF